MIAKGMSLAIFIVLLLFAFYFLWMKWSRAKSVSLGLAFFFLLFAGQGWIPSLLLNCIQSEPTLKNPDWKERNAIVVLGAGTVRWPDATHFTSYPLGYSRLYEAAQLYFKCKKTFKACSVVTSGGDPKAAGISEADVMKRELIEIGVSESDILNESKSKNTFQNAQFSSEIIKSHSFDRIIVVTSGFHLRRALLYFSHFNISALGAPSDRLEPIFSIIPLAYNLAFNDIAIHEYGGLLLYRFYELMGWNSVGTPQAN